MEGSVAEALVCSTWRPWCLGTRLLKGSVERPLAAQVSLPASPLGGWWSTQMAWVLLLLAA